MDTDDDQPVTGEQGGRVQASVTLIRCTVLDGHMTRDVEISASPQTDTAEILAALPFDLAGRTVYCGEVPLKPDSMLAESPVTPGCVLTIGAPGPPPFAVPGEAVGALNVLAGPSAGSWAWVRTGAPSTIGRHPRSTLVLDSSDVSRNHASVTVTATNPPRVELSDHKSTNGTIVGEAAIKEPTELPAEGLFVIGDDVIQWLPLERVDHSWTRGPDGHVEITRRFHTAPRYESQRVELPRKPAERTQNTGHRVMALATPMVMGVGMFAMSPGNNPLYLLIVLASPLTFLLQQFLERRTHARQQQEYAEAQAESALQIAKAVTAEERVRRFNDPGPLALRLYAAGGLPGLWTRQRLGGDALRFRVGVRDIPSSLTLAGDRWKGLDQPLQRAVPVTVDLAQIGVLGIAGPRPAARDLLNWVLTQLATRRSPDDLHLYLVSSGDGEDLAWARWLPHLDVGDVADVPCRIALTDPSRDAFGKELADIVEAREKDRVGHSGPVDFGHQIIVVLDGARELRKRPDLLTVLRRGAEVGVYTLCLDTTDINECRGKVVVATDGHVLVFGSHASFGEPATAETLPATEAEVTARLLAPLQDPARTGGGADDVPYPVRFLDLLDLHTPTEDDVIRLWTASPGPTTSVPIGANAAGPVRIDLARQGPHAMLAGTTGAGKSVLLQSLVTSLLMHNRPDELNLVLVDFKGGAAFLPFVEFPGDDDERRERERAAGRRVRCPHVVALIRSTEGDPASDFDETAARRVIASLKAEVSRREGILARYGGELDRYLAEKPADQPVLPRLVLVFDEFARVLDIAPGFMPQLVNVAGKGRSLGMHLLLATQSLSGKLTPELKNNVDLRLSLRQNEKADSTEVLDAPDAASLPGRLRGRGYIVAKKADSTRPRLFQTGHLVAPPPPAGTPAASTRIVEWSALGDPRPELEEHHPKDELKDIDLAIAAIEAASTDAKAPPPFRPLLPPLPPSLVPAELAELATEAVPEGHIPFGLADEPSRQAQPAFTFPLDGSRRLMIAGGPQSGRTTALRAILHAAVHRYRPDDLHLYLVEREPAGLSDYEALPHVGAVIGPDEPDRLRRFITWLGGETARRDQTRFSRTETPPNVLVLIDGWELIHDPLDHESFETSLSKTLIDVIRTGPKVGVHLIVACDKGPLTRKLGELFDTRLVLPFAQADITKSMMPSGTPIPPPLKGRALLASVGTQVQITALIESADDLLAARAQAVCPPPKTFPPLPRHVSLTDIERPADASPTWIALGLGGDDSGPIGVDLFSGPSVLLVSGGAGSGRSTAAVNLTRQLAGGGVGCVVLATNKSPAVAALAGVPRVQVLAGTTFDDATVRATADALCTSKVAIIVDDAERISVTPREVSFETQPTLLREACSSHGRLGLTLCGNGLPLMEGRRSLSFEARNAATEGTLLIVGSPTRSFLREHGFELEPDQVRQGDVGRGHIWMNARPWPIQLAGPRSESRRS